MLLRICSELKLGQESNASRPRPGETPLKEAIHLYRSSGYREVARFNDESYTHHWLEKTLNSGA